MLKIYKKYYIYFIRKCHDFFFSNTEFIVIYSVNVSDYFNILSISLYGIMSMKFIKLYEYVTDIDQSIVNFHSSRN